MKDFVTMCQKIGQMVDYVQGGGGNASCKHDENKMAIKASGFTIKDITEESGYVDVDFLKIKEYHTDVKAEELQKREKESTPFTLSCVFPAKDGSSLRPSVETGFHSMMKKYVMHTHPVYVNVITCADGGEALAKEILPELDFIWIPYINPGFSLSLAIGDAISDYENKNGVFPKVIFLENHGLITTSDDAEECTVLHIRVNDAIKKHLKLKDFYGDFSLKQEGEALVCTAPVIADYFSKYGLEDIEKNALYPDQLVYLNSGLKDGKIIFEDNKVIFKTAKTEAMAMLETFAAFAYIVDSMQTAKLTVHTMDNAATGFINNWESEKYRKSVAKQG